MEDEYGDMSDKGEGFIYPGVYSLESGATLTSPEIRYNTYGDPSSPCLLINHALTGNSSLHTWWGSMLGPGLTFDTDKYFVVCSNVLGSCYGSTSSLSTNPETGSAYGSAFPKVAVRDTVCLQAHLLASLGVTDLKSVIGGSFGGMQTLEYPLVSPSVPGAPQASSIVPISCGLRHTAWQIAISALQRNAVEMCAGLGDESKGLEIARQIGMVTYRSRDAYDKKFGRQVVEGGEYDVEGYLRYQGEKFLGRFDADTYVRLTEQMDSHDVFNGREGGPDYGGIKSFTIGISSDVLYPVSEQKEVAAFLQGGYGEVESEAGHDGFLLEQAEVGRFIREFLEMV